jgi:hypothetical protein
MVRNITIPVTVMLIIFSLAPGLSWAHKPLLGVSDNNDGTMSIEAGFSDGSSAAGHKIILKNQQTGEILLEQKVGEDGTLDLKKPTVNFTVTLDAGEGHTVTKEGPAPAESGATLSVEKGSANNAVEPTPAQISGASPGIPVGPSTAPLGMVATAKSQGGVIGPDQSPGFVSGSNMALQTLLVTLFVTATASVILLGLAMYFIGYRMGSRSITISNRKEARGGCSWAQDSCNTTN